jgi:hypothetical protein
MFKTFPQLAAAIAAQCAAQDAVIDVEIVRLDGCGRPAFNDLMFRHDQPFFYAFDLLIAGGTPLATPSLCPPESKLRYMLSRCNVGQTPIVFDWRLREPLGCLGVMLCHGLRSVITFKCVMSLSVHIKGLPV